MDKIEKLAQQAKADQARAMQQAARDAPAAYWAGSITASLAHHVRRGAVRKVRA